MKVLVLGANGRLGKALVAAINEHGGGGIHEVVAFVRDTSAFPAELAAKCTAVVAGDARSHDEIIAALSQHGCQALVNAAGYTPFLPGVHTDLPLIFEAALDAAEVVGLERSRVEGCGSEAGAQVGAPAAGSTAAATILPD